MTLRASQGSESSVFFLFVLLGIVVGYILIRMKLLPHPERQTIIHIHTPVLRARNGEEMQIDIRWLDEPTLRKRV